MSKTHAMRICLLAGPAATVVVLGGCGAGGTLAINSPQPGAVEQVQTQDV